MCVRRTIRGPGRRRLDGPGRVAAHEAVTVTRGRLAPVPGREGPTEGPVALGVIPQVRPIAAHGVGPEVRGARRDAHAEGVVAPAVGRAPSSPVAGPRPVGDVGGTAPGACGRPPEVGRPEVRSLERATDVRVEVGTLVMEPLVAGGVPLGRPVLPETRTVDSSESFCYRT